MTLATYDITELVEGVVTIIQSRQPGKFYFINRIPDERGRFQTISNKHRRRQFTSIDQCRDAAEQHARHNSTRFIGKIATKQEPITG